ncbi:MAG: hypothetical protein ACI89L_001524 [Phycisphaerales bacterium]|jgi:hypothetical protein
MNTRSRDDPGSSRQVPLTPSIEAQPTPRTKTAPRHTPNPEQFYKLTTHPHNPQSREASFSIASLHFSYAVRIWSISSMGLPGSPVIVS